jgi:hypothetical protein
MCQPISRLGLSIEDTKKAADEKTKRAAAGLQDTGDVVDAKVSAIKAGADNQEQNAIQGTVDAARWIDILDGYDQALARQEDLGAAYIDRTKDPLAEEQKGRTHAVDVAPLVAAAQTVVDSAALAPGMITDLGNKAVDEMPGRVGIELPAGALTPAIARGHTLVGEIVRRYQAGWETIGGVGTDAIAKAGPLTGGSDWATFDNLLARVEEAYRGLEATEDQALAEIDATLQEIADAVVDKASTPNPTPAPDGTKDQPNGGAHAPGTPPPPPTPAGSAGSTAASGTPAPRAP